jgi:hypothetical protein
MQELSLGPEKKSHPIDRGGITARLYLQDMREEQRAVMNDRLFDPQQVEKDPQPGLRCPERLFQISPRLCRASFVVEISKPSGRLVET